MVLFTLIGYFLVYSGLILATVHLLRKYAKAGPTPAQPISMGEDLETELSPVVG
jgi:cytochrome bd-type quinol oxidase subunit 1